MKKILVSLCVLSALAAATSCNKDGVSMGRPMTATIEEEYIDGFNALYWQNGSDFGLFQGAKANQQYVISSGVNTRTGKFTASGDHRDGGNVEGSVAVSPYCSSATATMTDGVAVVKTVVPSTITYSQLGVFDAGVCPLVAISGDKTARNFGFIAPLGGVSCKLSGSDYKVKRVIVTAVGGEIINGDMTVTFDKDGVKKVEMGNGSSSTLIECPNGIQLSTIAKEFVVFLPYQTYSQGFNVEVETTEGEINMFEAAGPIEVHKARVLNIINRQLVTYVDLNADNPETANCYCISEAGGYYFNATVKGVGQSGIHSTFKDQSATLEPKGAKLVWDEVNGNVTGVSYKDGKIYFASAGKQGNAVIAATNATGEIIWSWHIWNGCTAEDEVLGDYTALNMNIGASKTEDVGLYYQWGRKDPFSSVLAFDSAAGEGKYHPVEGGSSATELNTVAYSVSHPASYLANCGRNSDWLLDYPQRYLWGLNFEADGLGAYPKFKSIYDPCPRGYEVPGTNFFADGLAAAENKGTHITLFGGKMYIPAGGFIYNGGYGWYGQGSWTGLWTCSTAWGNVENGFRLNCTNDARDNYDRATGHPVRCIKIVK